jgi:hypothetical protein
MSKSSKNPPAELPEALRDRKIIDAKETFRFGCNKDLPCFTDCCSDVNILLTPLDIVRIARRVGLDTHDFLNKHTQIPVTKELQLPVIALRMDDDNEKRCPFLGDDGCSIYEDRPWSCRMYPLGMAIPPARAGVKPEPIFFLFEDDFCHGRTVQQEWTAETWRQNQELIAYEPLEAGYTEIVTHPWFIGGRTLDPKRIEMFHTAFYDLDSFRRFIFSSTFLDRFELEEELIDKLKNSDEELLKFAPRWLRFALFAEPTMKARSSTKV